MRSTDVLAGVVALAVALHFLAPGVLEAPVLLAWSTVFVAVCLQAFPFLVLGVALSAAIGTLVPPSFFARVLPRRPALAVPVAGMAGVVLPGCECASVPVAGSLVRRGVTPAAALAFLLAAPAVNPVVVVATLVAFPGRPEMAAARWLAALATALTVGWLWTRWGRPLPPPPGGDGGSPRQVFLHTVVDDTSSSIGYLAVGAAAGATLSVLVPRHWIDALADLGLISVLALALLAVLLAVCSEADAFIAASLRAFSPTAQLAFMVVGPVVDLKLVALQTGAFGPAVTRRLAPLSFAVAVLAATVVGGVLL